MPGTGWTGKEALLKVALVNSITTAITAAGGSGGVAIQPLAEGIANGLIPFLVANSLVQGVAALGVVVAAEV